MNKKRTFLIILIGLFVFNANAELPIKTEINLDVNLSKSALKLKLGAVLQKSLAKKGLQVSISDFPESKDSFIVTGVFVIDEQRMGFTSLLTAKILSSKKNDQKIILNFKGTLDKKPVLGFMTSLNSTLKAGVKAEISKKDLLDTAKKKIKIIEDMSLVKLTFRSTTKQIIMKLHSKISFSFKF